MRGQLAFETGISISVMIHEGEHIDRVDCRRLDGLPSGLAKIITAKQ
jgi:hypothetical protein